MSEIAAYDSSAGERKRGIARAVISARGNKKDKPIISWERKKRNERNERNGSEKNVNRMKRKGNVTVRYIERKK